MKLYSVGNIYCFNDSKGNEKMRRVVRVVQGTGQFAYWIGPNEVRAGDLDLSRVKIDMAGKFVGKPAHPKTIRTIDLRFSLKVSAS